MGWPELYYIESLEEFFGSGYRANSEYNLRAAAGRYLRHAEVKSALITS